MSLEFEVADPLVPLRRIRLLRWIIVAIGFLLIARLWWLQVARGQLYEQLSTGMRTRRLWLPAPRGLIYDRAGRVLATTTPEYIAVADRLELRRLSASERAASLARTAAILGISTLDIQDALDRGRRSGLNNIPLKGGIGPAVITHLLEDAEELPGVDVEQVPVRSYPMGNLAAHVLGYLRDVSDRDLKNDRSHPYNGADQVGEQGLERFYESVLRGIDGERVVEVNARGIPVASTDLSLTAPTPGNSLLLTLDIRLQRAAQDAFPKGESGAAVALDVRTGGVLAFVSQPGFDPNVFVQDSAEAHRRKAAYLMDSSGPLQDRAITHRYPPGSTFKIVTAAAGFAAGDIQPGATVYCDGGLRLAPGQWKQCWARHGSVNFEKAMAESCDTYFYDLMKRLSASALAATAAQFGMGKYCGIDLPSESHGFVPTPDWKERRFPGDQWWYGDSCNMAIGQGFLQVTPLQMAVATAALANGGRCLRPYLVERVLKPGRPAQVVSETQTTVNGSIDVSQDALALIREGMRAAVEPGGTAAVARFPDLDVAAKTGSAQVPPDPRTHAWFICFAPYKNPQIAICVLVEHGGHGGSTAGPVARAMLKAYFHLKDTGSRASNLTD